MFRSSLLALSVLVCVPVSEAAGGNVDTVKEMVAAINDRDFAALDDLMAADVVRHSAATPDVVVTNLEEFKAFLKADFSACPDAKQEIDLIFGEGDFVAVRGTYVGTQTGAMGPFPPSGNSLRLPFLGILRLEDGKIKELWVEWDNLNALMQLGHFPRQTD